MLAARGAVVCDADRMAHEALNRKEVVRRLVGRWGPSVVRGGRVRRREVAKRVFADDREREFLEALVHPCVIKATQRDIAWATKAGKPLVVIDAPLLMEAGMDGMCDAVLYIDAPRAARLRRARRAKGLGPEEVRRRERAMMPLGEKRGRATRVLRNDAALDRLEHKLGRFLGTFSPQVTSQLKGS